MKGRHKKSPELAKLQGNTRRQKKPAIEEVTPDVAPQKISAQNNFFSLRFQPAAWLADGAKLIWAEQLAIALRETKLQESGLQVFAIYCDAVYRLQKYSQEIEVKGATYTTASGYVRKRPEVEMRDKAANDVRNYASELNLTPKSWIGSMGTFAGKQLDMFMNGGRIDSVQPDVVAAPGDLPPKGDTLSAFLGDKPTIN